MRALIGGTGSDWQLADRDIPSQLGAIRVQVMAAGINRADLYALEGTYTANSQAAGEYTAGMEVAGVIEISSPLASHLPVGTRVMGITAAAFADYALCDPRLVVPIPDGLTFDQAATLPVGLITEHDALVTQGGFSSGQTVLIVGGTSAIGLVGIQLAKALGARIVIATTTTEDKRSALLEAGADVTVNTRTEDLAAVVVAATDGAGADITLDHIGGPLFGSLPGATAIGGTIVSIGRLAGPATELNLDTIAFRRQRLLGTTFSIRTRAELAEVVGALSPEVLPALIAGKIAPNVAAVYPPERAVEAAQQLRANAALGKIVLSFADAHTGPAPAPAPRANMFGSIAQMVTWCAISRRPWPDSSNPVSAHGFTSRTFNPGTSPIRASRRVWRWMSRWPTAATSKLSSSPRPMTSRRCTRTSSMPDMKDCSTSRTGVRTTRGSMIVLWPSVSRLAKKVRSAVPLDVSRIWKQNTTPAP